MRLTLALLLLQGACGGEGPDVAEEIPSGGEELVVDADAPVESADPEREGVAAEGDATEELGPENEGAGNEGLAAEPPPADPENEDDGFNAEGGCCADEEEISDEPEETPDVDEAQRTVAGCFEEIGGDLGPDYDQFEPRVGTHCMGTDHQDIEGIERLVFLGDSVTVGTPPWLMTDYYWARLYEALKGRFGDDLEVQNCAKWGARTDDLLEGKAMIQECFPEGGDDRKTLVVMTIGGNDLAAWAQDLLGLDEAMVEAERAAIYLDDALAWFREPGRFPNGVSVIVANPYEYTDATGDVESCPAAAFAGMEGNWIEGAPAVIHLHERYMEMSVRHGTDIVFLLEAFCGHGFHHDNPESQCYRGPDAEVWFDFTCIHPNPTGHAVIADMFEAVVAE